MKHRPTIRDVARKAGLSLSTVSLAINNRGYVSDRTRSRVLRVVEQLGYHPTRAAKGLASRTSGNLGFILSEDHFSQAEPFYTRIFLGTEFEARKHNFYILLTTVGRTFGGSDAAPRFLLERNVDGVILAGRINEKLVQHIDSLGLPVVLVDFELKRGKYSSVQIDNRGGARLAVDHLLDLGHRSVAFIGGDPGHPSITERREGYLEAIRERGLAVPDGLLMVTERDTRFSDGFQAAQKLFASGARPTAVFAANDAMAIGCIRYAKGAGLRVPEDLAIIGFDDIDMSSHIEPRLTTVRVYKEELGKLAVQQVVDLIHSKARSVVTARVPVELVVRESTVVRQIGQPAEMDDPSPAAMREAGSKSG